MDIVRQLETLYVEKQNIKVKIVRLKQQRQDTTELENQLQNLNEQILKAKNDLKKDAQRLKAMLKEQK